MSQSISYPVGNRTLTSIDQYKAEFFPIYRDFKNINIRMQNTVKILRAFAIKNPRNLRMLDYGCGVGGFLFHLSNFLPGWRFEGWEGDPSSVAIADECFKRSNITFREKSYLSYAELDANSFDSISFLEVIEHVDNPGTILSNFHRALTDGGLLLISTPNATGWNYVSEFVKIQIFTALKRKSKVVAGIAQEEYDKKTSSGHICAYTFSTLSRLLKANGFEVIDYTFSANSNRILEKIFPETLIILSRKVSHKDPSDATASSRQELSK